MIPRRLLPLATGVLLALSATPAAAQRPEVVKLRFEGAESFGRAELESAIMTRATRCSNPVYSFNICLLGWGRDEVYLDLRELEPDALRLRVFYYERGFRDATVGVDTLARGENAVEVVFRIDEGRPVRVAEVEVAGAPESLAGRPLPLRPGEPFDVLAYESSRDTLLARLRNTGFARAQVLLGYMISADDPYAASVQYEVVPGTPARFGEVAVVGTEEASPELVHRMLTFREGDRYDRSALLESQRNLYSLQIFRHAEVQADLAAEPDSLVPVVVEVAEGPMHRVRLGGGFNDVECVNVEGRWASRNFRGEGRRLEVRGRLGNLLMDPCRDWLGAGTVAHDSLTGLVSLDFTQPWFFGPRNRFGVGLFAERRSVPGVFFRRAVGGYVSVGRSLDEQSAITLAFRPEQTQLDAEGELFFCVNFVACAIEDVTVLQEPHWLAPLTLSLSMDRTDAVFAPSRGFVLRADVEHAGPYTLSDFAYTRLFAEGSAYKGRAQGVVLATRLRGGIAWPHHGSAGTETVRINPQKRFFAGGANSVRGLDQYRLGPTVLGIDAVPWLVATPAADPAGSGPAPDEAAGCTVASVNDGSCDASPLRDGLFDLRPAGGEVLLEGNVELRFPLPLWGGKLRGAAFVDAGQVWTNPEAVALGEIVTTPGLGLRYYSPVGPIRIDAGFDTQGPRSLPVLATEVEPCIRGESGCVEVGGPPRQQLRNTDDVVTLARAVEYGTPLSAVDSWGDFFRRVTFHFSIGQAF